MARETEVYNRSVAGSVGAGLGSLMAKSGKRYYVLEHKVSSRFHKAGESQQIIIDQIELGRDPKCQVRFDDSFTTVSRRHAAIVRDGDNWKLLQLSTTNSTLLNGVPIKSEWYLQNGDEIQLSMNGPKLGFIVPQGDKSLVKSIGLSRRLSLFRQQALLPYKKAMWAMAAVFVLCVAALTFWIMQQSKTISKQGGELVQQGATIDSLQVVTAEQLMTIGNLKSSADSMNAAMKREMAKLRKQPSNVAPIQGNTFGNEFASYAKNVYFLKVSNVSVRYQGQVEELTDYKWTATGFLLDDGHLVTARHCIDPWHYPVSTEEEARVAFMLSVLEEAGAEILVNITAYSNDGSQFNLTNRDFDFDTDDDVRKSFTGDDGNRYTYRIVSDNSSDIASTRTSRTGGLKYDATLSRQLQQGEAVYVLGYPFGLGADVSRQRDIQPLLSTSLIGRSGLSENGQIQLSNRSFDSGNSGGPVMVQRDGQYIVVAVVSQKIGTVGLVAPICRMK